MSTLQQIMNENKLTPEMVAKLMNKPIRTVFAWLSPSDGVNSRNIPDSELERLVLLLFACNTQLKPVTRAVWTKTVERVAIIHVQNC